MAVIVTVDVPGGVPGVTFLSSEQPANNPLTATNAIITPSSRSVSTRVPLCRRLRKISTELTGISNAKATPERPRLRLSVVVVIAVWIVTDPVATDVEETGTEEGEKLHVAFAGKPEHARVTFPLKPFTGATLTVGVVEPPTGTVAADADVLNPKVGAAPAVVAFVMPASNPCDSSASPAVKYTVFGFPPLTPVEPVTAVPCARSSHRLA